MVEWSITRDCKSVGISLRWFESNPAHMTKQIWTSPDFFVLVRAGDMFLSAKTVEVGSWKFKFDETEIIPDHKTIPAREFFASGSRSMGMLLQLDSKSRAGTQSPDWVASCGHDICERRRTNSRGRNSLPVHQS